MSYNEGVTKKAVIRFILETPGPVEEPKIRKSLKNKLGKKDDSNIRRCIKELHSLRCIQKMPTRKGYANKWNISSTKNLRNIKKEFPEMDLKQYKKTADIIDFTISKSLNVYMEQLSPVTIDKITDVPGKGTVTLPEPICLKWDSSSNKLGDFVQTVLKSESMFKAVLWEDIETLYPRWVEMSKLQRHLIQRYKDNNPPSPFLIIRNAFEHYVNRDVADGCENTGAVKQVRDNILNQWITTSHKQKK